MVHQNKVKITCVEAAPKMLPMFSEELVNHAVSYLEDRGVEFKIATPIVACNEKGFVVEVDGEKQQLNAGTSVWAAGVRGSKLMEESFEGVKRGRIVTKQDLTINGYDNILLLVTVQRLSQLEKNVHYQLQHKLQCNKVKVLLKH